jgi:hypothetical protein
MPWFDIPAGKVWAGYHRILGAVVFDPGDQVGVPPDRVRLFLKFKNDVSLLNKATAHNCMVRTDDSTDLERAILAYRLLQAQRNRAAQPRLPMRFARRPNPRVRKSPCRAKADHEPDSPPREETPPRRGICVRCRFVIPPIRLEACPGAIRCVQCQAAWERETGGEPPAVRDLAEAWFPRSEHWRNRGRRRKH